MHPIDVHIITFNETPEQRDRCLASLEGQPVNVHMVQGTAERPPVQGRLRGFAVGSAPLVSYVDPDDWVEPGAYEKLLVAIGDKDAVYGWEWCHLPSGECKIRTAPHHAFVLRRGLAIDYSTSWRVFQQLQPNSVAKVSEPLYNWTVGYRYVRLG